MFTTAVRSPWKLFARETILVLIATDQQVKTVGEVK